MQKEVSCIELRSLCEELDTNQQKGLNQQQVEQRQKEYGKNTISTQKPQSAFSIFRQQFRSLIIYVLYVAAFISLLIGDMIEYLVILGIILFIVLLSFFEEYKATRDMEALKKLTPRECSVLRDGKKITIQAEDIVPGDILYLERGDIVSADARVISSLDLRVDESSLTGESVAVLKQPGVMRHTKSLSDQTNMVFGGSPVANGRGVAVVTGIGNATQLGKVAQMLGSIKQEPTILQQRIDRLSKQFSAVILVICVFIFFVGLLQGQSWQHMLILAVAVAVAGIPESLPAVIGVALAVGTKRMARNNAIIKRLPAVETLGTCTVICTDKTGTLTQNKMVSQRLFFVDEEIEVTGEGFTPTGQFLRSGDVIDPLEHPTLKQMIHSSVLCNNATLTSTASQWTIDGEATDGALVVLGHKAGLFHEQMHRDHPRIHEHPFDPDRKRMSVLHTVGKKKISYVKGAPELLLDKCVRYLDKKGVSKRLNKQIIDRILEQNHAYATKGLRVIALANKEYRGAHHEMREMESGLTFLGLVAIRDPPEPSVDKAIATCREAGIKVVMITGDNPITATAIATEIGIYDSSNTVITGAQLMELSDAELLKIIDSITVYARTTPEQKLRIVQLLQKKGHVVAMTGDGVNDAPALKAADIGVAMGRSGTEVAKEAAEMVIKDDNFSTIVKAVEEGRTIFSNIRKFLYYLLAGNLSQVIIIFIASLLGVIAPLTALMILFVNLITSDFPAMGLAVEKAHPNIMRERPRNPKEGILNEYVLLKVAEVVPIIVLGTIVLYVWELVVRGESVAKSQTLALVSIIMFMIFHAFNAKSFHESVFARLGDNKIFLACIVGSIVATFAVVYWAPMQAIFGTQPIRLFDWFLITLLTSVILIFTEAQKTLLSLEIKERDKMVIHPTRRSV